MSRKAQGIADNLYLSVMLVECSLKRQVCLKQALQYAMHVHGLLSEKQLLRDNIVSTRVVPVFTTRNKDSISL